MQLRLGLGAVIVGRSIIRRSTPSLITATAVLLSSTRPSSASLFATACLSASKRCEDVGSTTAGGRLLTSSERPLSLSATAAMSASSAAVVPATDKHTATVIFLHGLGDTGNGWSPVFRDMIRAPHIKYICPHAPNIPVTINMGMQMPAWFDIYGLTIGSKEDEDGIKASAKKVHQLLDAEIASGVPSERIMLGGFSMGGALALYATLTYPKKLAGVIGLSSFMLLKDQLGAAPQAANKDTPVFQGHGDADPLVGHTFGKMTHEFIKQFNPNAVFNTYPGMEHAACDKELKDVKEFIQKYIPPVK